MTRRYGVRYNIYTMDAAIGPTANSYFCELFHEGVSQPAATSGFFRAMIVLEDLQDFMTRQITDRKILLSST